MGIEIILDKCTGCGLCVKVCPFAAIKIKDKKAEIEANCTLCGSCIEVCNFDAILIERQNLVIKISQNIRMYGFLWNYVKKK